jgi:hypothetical protein
VPTVPTAGIHGLPQREAVLMSAFGEIADIERCLLYSQKRTLVERVVMSALCQ